MFGNYPYYLQEQQKTDKKISSRITKHNIQFNIMIFTVSGWGFPSDLVVRKKCSTLNSAAAGEEVSTSALGLIFY